MGRRGERARIWTRDTAVRRFVVPFLPLVPAAVALAAIGCAPGAPGEASRQAAVAADAGLGRVGPRHPGHGFPLWYADRTGARAQICVPDNALCGAPPDGFDPAQPVRFPGNFPDEFFYWSATASAALDATARVDLVLALEGTFFNGFVQAGQRTTFGRLRIRGFNLPAGTYHITHPYGVDEFVVEDVAPRNINFTEDVLPVPEVFTGALDSRIGPLLAWDSGAPAGFFGDPATPHTVTGSPSGTNELIVDVLDSTTGQLRRVASTNQFTVLGKRSEFDVVASVEPGRFGTPQFVTLAATDPATIFFTTDGSEPTPASTPFTAPILIDATTTLAFIAVSGDGQTRSPVHTGVYTIDPALLTIVATPAGGVFDTLQAVELAASDPTAQIYFTIDGSDPTPATGTPFTGPISLGRNGDFVLKFIALPLGAGAAPSAVQTERYSIRVPQLTVGPIDGNHQFPASYRDATGLSLSLCLGTATAPGGAPLCVLPAASATFDPAQPIAFPTNFPDESFYFSATASLTIPPTPNSTGGTMRVVLALEAAFANGPVEPGQQVTFGRVRIRAGGLEVGGRYRVTHPYGVDVFDVSDGGQKSINATEDVLPVPGSFRQTAGSRIGPFLTWAPPDEPPAGFIGIPGVLHQVVGSPFSTNFVLVEELDGTTWRPVAQTDLFDVMGMGGGRTTAPPGFGALAASPAGGLFTDPPVVGVTVPAPGSTVFATTDGSDPRTSRTRFQVTGAIVLASSTTLKLVALAVDGTWSAVKTEIYIVTTPPVVGPPVPGHPPVAVPEIAPLGTVPVPTPGNLDDFVKDRTSAIALGKALFWDQQVGSDGVQACATCHFNAGADSRSKNQINPGTLARLPDGTPDPAGTLFTVGGASPNVPLAPDRYPLHRFADPSDRHSSVVFDTLNVTSSQGVFNTKFASITPGLEEGTAFEPDPVFNVNRVTVRRVEPRNTPTVINAVFNFRNFWDGRAQNRFNGVNPSGDRDPAQRDARRRNGFLVKTLGFKTAGKVYVLLDNASLASQAVGPVLNSFEMSAEGRTFAHVGLKLLRAGRGTARKLSDLRPLAGQAVSPTDSVLGALVDPSGKGLRTSYGALIQRAFRDEWWNQDSVAVHVAPDGTATLVLRPSQQLADNEFTVMEWNFSMFFGLAVQLYESTLISDQTPFDRFLSGSDNGAFTAQAQRGLVLFQTKGRCINCHGGAELTNASVSNVTNQRLERMIMGDLRVGTYDNGFYNIGVRSTFNDIGLGGSDPFGNPLSLAAMAKLGKFTDPQVPVAADARIVANGAFKVPGLRNVELTAPYFHNGGQLTLRQVVEFYDRGGDFHDANRPDLDAEIDTIGFSESEKDDVVAFLRSLTDDRVRFQRAPFDHPELIIPDGHPGDQHAVPVDPELPGKAQDWDAAHRLVVPPVGAAGGAPLPMFLDQAQ